MHGADYTSRPFYTDATANDMAPRRRQVQEQQKGGTEVARWLQILKSILYELRPFSLPTRANLINFRESTRSTIILLGKEGYALFIHICNIILYLLKHITWKYVIYITAFLFMSMVAIWLEFGLVFFIFATLGLIFTVGLSDEARRPGQLSAWSVFNEGMTRLLGTIDAEALAQQYAGGAGAAAMMPAAPPVAQRGGGGGDDGWEVELIDAGEGDGAADYDGGGGGGATGRGGQGGGGGARKSGKKMRRRFDKEERRRKRELLAAAAGGGGGRYDDGFDDDYDD